MHGLGSLEIIKLAIYFASYLYIIAAPLSLWLIARRRGLVRYISAAFFAAITCLAYARFVEPRMLLTAEHDIELNECFAEAGAFRVAVFSDTHNGLFGNAMPIERIVNRINQTGADFVLAPGDFVYFLHPDKFDQTFESLAHIKAPVFAVLGNHDIGLPGPDLRAPLNATLPSHGVRLIDNRVLILSNSKFNISLAGLSDQWEGRQKLSLLENSASTPRLVLTHNPASVRDFTPAMQADLLIAGHTHGGQIKLPFATCRITGVCGDIAYGLREERNVQIFTTSGTGMVGLPLRFRVPPRIDMLNVRYKACQGS